MRYTQPGTSLPNRRSTRTRLPQQLLALLAVGFSTAAGAQDHTTHHAGESLGRAHFAISCSPAAQAEFDRALAPGAPEEVCGEERDEQPV